MQMTPKYTYLYLQQTQIVLLHTKTTVLVIFLAEWLGLNADKRDFIIISTSRQLSKITRFLPTPVLNHSRTPSHTVRNLSIAFDGDFNFRILFSQICRCYFYHIDDLFRIRLHISLIDDKTIATTLITSRLDHVNFNQYTIAHLTICKALVCSELLSQGSHRVSFCASPEIASLVPCSISDLIFKFCIIAYQTFSSEEPSYLFCMLSPASKLRGLRSTGFHFLSVPTVKTHAGARDFSDAVPTLWNSLHEHVKSSNSIFSFRYHLENTRTCARTHTNTVIVRKTNSS